MNYLEFQFKVKPYYPGANVLTQFLSDIGFESFVEEDEVLLAYIPEEEFQDNSLQFDTSDLLKPYNISYSRKVIEQQNWNEEWEKNYPDVSIGNRCRIRAPFHLPDEQIEYEILIEPKMSFGTAHHETTYQMIERLLEKDVQGLKVLDMGCGTGVLGILASMKGAQEIVAIDNDEWAYENALENFNQNKIENADVILGDENTLPNTSFDLILANINKNILLQSIRKYDQVLKKDGILIMSGFYENDINDIANFTADLGFERVYGSKLRDWAILEMVKR